MQVFYSTGTCGVRGVATGLDHCNKVGPNSIPRVSCKPKASRDDDSDCGNSGEILETQAPPVEGSVNPGPRPQDSQSTPESSQQAAPEVPEAQAEQSVGI